MKKYKSKSISNWHVFPPICRNLERLKLELVKDLDGGNMQGMTYLDIFFETILFLYSDIKAVNLKTDEEILKHFRYRFKMIRFRVLVESFKELHPIEGLEDNNDNEDFENE